MLTRVFIHTRSYFVGRNELEFFEVQLVDWTRLHNPAYSPNAVWHSAFPLCIYWMLRCTFQMRMSTSTVWCVPRCAKVYPHNVSPSVVCISGKEAVSSLEIVQATPRACSPRWRCEDVAVAIMQRQGKIWITVELAFQYCQFHHCKFLWYNDVKMQTICMKQLDLNRHYSDNEILIKCRNNHSDIWQKATK